MTKNWVNSVITNGAHFLGWFMEVFVVLLFLVSFQSPLSAQENAGDSGNVSLGALYFILPWTTHDDGLRSDVIITNTEQRQAQLQISAYDRNGLPVFVDNIINELGPGETSIIDTKLLPPNTASLRFDTDSAIDGSVNFGTVDGKKSATVPAFRTGSNQLNFPSLIDGDFKYRSLVLFNQNDQYAALAVSAFDKDGQEITPAPFDLMPMTAKETRTIALSEIFDTNIQSNVATVRIIANKPLIGFELANDVSRNLLLDQALAVSLSSVPMAASTPTWPLPGYKVGSNKFCSFVSGRGYHTGVDIGSPNLNPKVISMCKGFVVRDTTHRNTGNYLNYWNGFMVLRGFLWNWLHKPVSAHQSSGEATLNYR